MAAPEESTTTPLSEVVLVWAGIAEENKAKRTAQRATARKIFTGISMVISIPRSRTTKRGHVHATENTLLGRRLQQHSEWAIG
jgi:hypothetical protein